MPREKPNYRDMLQFLSDKYPMIVTQKQACEILGVSMMTLLRMIKRGEIQLRGCKITLGELARFLC